MPDMQFKQDLHAAITTLRNVEERFAALEAENVRLRDLVANMRRVLGVAEVGQDNTTAPSPVLSAQIDATPAWKSVEIVLRKLGGQSTINQIFSELQLMGVGIARDSIRTSMMRHQDVFYRVSDGIYDLVANRESPAA